MKKKLIKINFIICLLLPIQFALANHGPGTSGGGTSTQSGETLNEDQVVVSIDNTSTNYDNISRGEAENKAGHVGEFDALSNAYLTNMSVGYGITDDFQIEGGLGWYSGRKFIDAHKEEHSEHRMIRSSDSHHQDEVNSATGNPDGLTDLAIRGKYRLLKGASGHLSVLLGATLPVGDDGEKLSNGEKLEPSSQPGTGRYSTTGGLAYSKYLSPKVSFDISSLYTYRYEKDEFKIGDRLDNGITLSYRLTDSMQDFSRWSLFSEFSHQYIGKDKDSGERNGNSGGNIIYFSPGIRTVFNQKLGIAVAPSFPIVQDLNGEQLETDFRMMSQLSYKF